MPVQIKNIPGAMLESSKTIRRSRKTIDIGWDNAITQQGEVSIGLNREKLARKIAWRRSDYVWDKIPDYEKEIYYQEADDIIASEAEIIEKRV